MGEEPKKDTTFYFLYVMGLVMFAGTIGGMLYLIFGMNLPTALILGVIAYVIFYSRVNSK